MENNPNEAPAAAPVAPESEATPITNPAPAPAPAPNMYGFTSDQLAEMKKFYDANGGFEKVKSRLSNPEPTPSPVQPTEPTSQPQAQPVEYPRYQAPAGSITAQEFLAQQYFQSLANDPKYEGISSQVANGDILKEMASFNIQPLNQDGSINDQMIRRYLDLKAQTVPARATATEPNASNAPTVEYISVGEKINDINQAYQVLSQDAKLRKQGLAGHPRIADAEAFIKNTLNPNAAK